MTIDQGPPRGEWGRATVIILANFLPILAIMSLAPAIPAIIRHFAGAPSVELLVPLAVSAPAFAVAVLSPIMGWVIDRTGRRRLLLISSLLYAIAGMAPLLLGSLPMLFASRVILGIAEAALFTISATLMIDYFDSERRAFWLSMQGLAGPVLAILTVAGSGFLTNIVWNGAFSIYAIAFVVLGLGIVYAYEPKVSNPDPVSSPVAAIFPWRLVAIYSAIAFVFGNFFYAYVLHGALVFQDRGIGSSGTTGLLMSLAGLGVPIAAGSFAFLSKRISLTWLVTLCPILLGIGMGIIGAAPDYRLVLLGAFIQQLGSGFAINPLLFWAQGVLPDQHRGRGMGIWMSVFAFGQFTSPLLVGLVRNLMGGLSAAFTVLGIMALAFAIVVYLLIRLGEQLKAASAEPV